MPSATSLKSSASAPTLLPPIVGKGQPKSPGGGKSLNLDSVYSRGWTTETKRLLHEHRQRTWLHKQAKHRYIDFADAERAELRRYFDCLAEGGERIHVNRLEDMMISLGLARDRGEVGNIVEMIDHGEHAGELDFEEYLALPLTRVDSALFQVFKAMMEGKLGDRNLNFQTVISTYRRRQILDATGASTKSVARKEHGIRILHNFATLQRGRHATPSQGDSVARTAGKAAKDVPSFDNVGRAPVGTLGMMWRGVCHDHDLVSSRPASADGRKRTLDPPLSPREVISAILDRGGQPVSKSSLHHVAGGHRGTIVISAPDRGRSCAAKRRHGDGDGSLHRDPSCDGTSAHSTCSTP